MGFVRRTTPLLWGGAIIIDGLLYSHSTGAYAHTASTHLVSFLALYLGCYVYPELGMYAAAAAGNSSEDEQEARLHSYALQQPMQTHKHKVMVRNRR